MPSIHGRHYATGRRKRAVARVFLQNGSGSIVVNGKSMDTYFDRETSRMIIEQPFDVLGKGNTYDVECNVYGGGLSSQAEAIRHGISRALLDVDGEFRSPLKKAGLLTRDAREKERKKPGQPGARKKFQYSKR